MANFFVGNAFSLSMVAHKASSNLDVKTVWLQEAKDLLSCNEFTSCVGHATTANVMSTLLGTEVKMNRVNVTLNGGDRLLVFQLNGRLEEGALLTEEGLSKLNFKFMLVTVSSWECENSNGCCGQGCCCAC